MLIGCLDEIYFFSANFFSCILLLCYNPWLRGVAQPGSVLAWGASGRRFESSRPDQFNQAVTFVHPIRVGSLTLGSGSMLG